MTDTPGRDSNGIRLISADKDEFVPSTGITSAQAAELLKVHGPNELPEQKTPYVSSLHSIRVACSFCENFSSQYRWPHVIILMLQFVY